MFGDTLKLLNKWKQEKDIDMNQLKLNQLKAAGGVAVELIEHIDYLQRTVDIASRCMGEKQIENELLKDFLRDCTGGQCGDISANARQIADELGVRL